MTTPAINRNSIDTRPGIKSQVNWASPGGETPLPDSVFAFVPCNWESEHRPASGTVVPTGNGAWRSCRGWNHDSRHYVYADGSVTRFVDNLHDGYRSTYKGGSYWGNVSPPAVPAFPSGLINQAEVKALNRLKDQDFNLGQFMAEFDQTAGMVAAHVRRIARGVRRYRKMNPGDWKYVVAYERWGNTASMRRMIPKSWLELQYGWRPLLSDIFGAIHQLSKPDRLPLIHCKGYAKSETTLTTSFTSQVDSRSSCQLQYRVTHECWVSLYYQLNSPGLANQSQLGLLNPLELVWECLPYSFVVDWVLPIGPWMSSLTADAGFTFQGGSRSIKSVVGSSSLYSGRFYSSSGSSYPRVRDVGNFPEISGESSSFLRTCYTGSPVPGLYVKNPLSVTHVLNAIALLAGAFDRR